MTPRVLKARQAAQYIGRSLWSLRGMIERGELPVIKGEHENSPWSVDIQDLDRWIERNKTFVAEGCQYPGGASQDASRLVAPKKVRPGKLVCLEPGRVR